MNSNLNRALSAALLAIGGVVSAVAQVDTDYQCLDPNNTAPYSTDFASFPVANDLFGANIGISGTKAYRPSPDICEGGGPISGRIGFSIGSRGSFQDEDPNQAGSYYYEYYDFINRRTARLPVYDNYMSLTRGQNLGISFFGQYVSAPVPPIQAAGIGIGGAPPGGASFARVYVRRGTTTNSYLFGNGFNSYFVGASGRYVYASKRVVGDATGGVDVALTLEVIGDAARLNWDLTNNLVTTDAVSLGLYFAQAVDITVATTPPGSNVLAPVEAYALFNDNFATYTTIPGRRPLIVDERFGPAAGSTPTIPPYVNFSVGQAGGIGLQVVNSPSALTQFDPGSGLDQTPVDEFVYGSTPPQARPALFQADFNATDPAITDQLFNPDGGGNADAAPVTVIPGYLQKWQPSAVAAGATRRIVGYYRSTTGDSSYSRAFNGYSAVVDTPKTISTNPATITTGQPFRASRYTIRVNVDNTGGFSNVGTELTLQSVDVTLNLPAGMTNPDTGKGTTTKTISRIVPRGLAFVDFPVTVDPNLYGPQTYSVTISPNPQIGVKTITGTIDVAATPRLLIRPSANLVSPPFTFVDSSWESVLGLRLNQDFQAFTWDALAQQYVPQVSAERGRGTFIVSTSDLGYKLLGGSPSQPNDEFPDPVNNELAQNGGSAIIRLQPGWNLVGNPYNYAFPINQIVAAGSGASASGTFQDLIAQGFLDGTFQYYDQDGRQYLTISNSTSTNPLLLPNVGYWLYATNQVDIQFPPIYELFARSSKPKLDAPQTERNWKLQLSAVSPGAKDTQNFVGLTNDPQARSIRKAPMQPSARKADVVYAFVTGDKGAPLAQSLHQGTGTQSYTYTVFSKNGGPVTVSWPNLKALPSGFKVSITDTDAKKTVDARKTSGYSFTAKEAAGRTFTVTVQTGTVAPQKINSATYTIVRNGRTYAGKIGLNTAAKGAATLHLLRGAMDMGVIAKVDIAAGSNTITWPLTDGNGNLVPNGNYTVAIEATNDAGDVATRNLSIVVRR